MTLPAALAAMGAYKQWITYRLDPIADKPGKFDKLPCVPTTGMVTAKGSGGAHNPAIWVTADEAYRLAHLADGGHGSGVGFVFTKDDPFWVVDIDDCRDGAGWNATAKQVCAALPGAAVEVSQSGKGLHIFGSGAVPEHRCKNISLHLELYHTARFIALSKNEARGDAGKDMTGPIAALVDKYFAPMLGRDGATDDWSSEPCEEWSGPEDDDELIARACKPANKTTAVPDSMRFKDLYERNVAKIAEKFPPTGDGEFDASSADMSLAMHLAFWTGRDCERMERLMRASELYRGKYERRDYLTDTIMKAVRLNTKVLTDPVFPTPLEAFGGEPAAFLPQQPSHVPAPSRTQRHIALQGDMIGDKGNHLTIEYWLIEAGAVVRFDEFANTIRIGNVALDDHIARQMWLGIREKSNLKFAYDLFDHTLRGMGYANRYNPLVDYLDTVQPVWDGTPRMDGWLTRYLGVEANEYTSAVGALFLLALVRRVREPGAKFDEMLVLEGPQGIEKSSALAALCPQEEWFTDEASVGMTSKELLEITGGKWIVEAPELKGMTGRGVDHVKAFLSRRFDKARMAFERHTTERGRMWVPAATTNDARYLDDPTGNRRVWPVVATKVDLAGIHADRDQLWAEVCQREATGASIRLPQHLWAVAGEVQADRIIFDSFLEDVANLLGDKTGRVRGTEVLEGLGLSVKERASFSGRLGTAMRTLGWTNKPVKVDGKAVRYFVKGHEAASIILHNGKMEYDSPQLRAV